MENNYKLIADYYAFGIKLGLLNFDEPIGWADKVIMIEEVPPVEFIELSLGGARGKNAVLSLLAEIPGDSQPTIAGQMLLGLLLEELINGADMEGVARSALNVAWATSLPDTVRWEVDNIVDEIELVKQRVFEDHGESREALTRFLQEFGIVNAIREG